MAYDITAFSVTLMFMAYVVEITEQKLMDCSYLKHGVMRSVSNKDAIRLWHIWWWFHWASFRNQTTMIAITRGTKNEGACVTRRRLPSCSSCKSTAKRKIATYKCVH